MVVYADVHGWKPLPYIGAGEFYLEYGDYDVTLTLPAGFVLAATGTGVNPARVWTPTVRARLARAGASAALVPTISKAEGRAHRPKRAPGTNTRHLRTRQ